MKLGRNSGTRFLGRLELEWTAYRNQVGRVLESWTAIFQRSRNRTRASNVAISTRAIPRLDAESMAQFLCGTRPVKAHESMQDSAPRPRRDALPSLFSHCDARCDLRGAKTPAAVVFEKGKYYNRFMPPCRLALFIKPSRRTDTVTKSKRDPPIDFQRPNL